MEGQKAMKIEDNVLFLQQLTNVLNNSKLEVIENEGGDTEACHIIITRTSDVEAMKRRIEKICNIVDDKDTYEGSTQALDTLICKHLNEIGVPASLKGYRYMITAIKEVLKDEMVLEGITKILYPNIAKKHDSTSQRVEKAIRHAIEVAWARNNGSKLKYVFKYTATSGRTRPTNSEFIAALSCHIKMEHSLESTDAICG